ncbi:hypothetical protein GpartN1_g538.t1 [Galdieria partita]|uniref:Uncharacterized protein n=1 Tax=Galdieria partita TaxID=83374 RepID=A0A9C7PRL1_9RHOD|nr:hypothetical protein GpartN1_g538.t1 [Galdieria partita]
MFAAVERLSRVVGHTFSRSSIQEALMKAKLDENLAVNLLLDGHITEVATATQVDSFEKAGVQSSLEFDYSQHHKCDLENSNHELVALNSDSSDDEVVVVDAWPKKLGDVTINGFLTVNCRVPFSKGSFVSLGANVPVVWNWSRGIGLRLRIRDKGKGIVRIYLKDLEIGRVLGEISGILAPLLTVKFIRVCGRVLSVTPTLKRNEHLVIRASIYVNREAFEEQTEKDTTYLHQCLIGLLSTLGLHSSEGSTDFNLPSYPKLETQTLFPLSRKGWITQLRPYQEYAVKWMMNRENADLQPRLSDPLWEHVEIREGFNFYINRTFSVVSLTKPTSQAMVLGGVLADEMGLGKTVQTIALIAGSSPLGEERIRQGINGTLIVVPLSLLNQWLEEFYTHVEENTFEILTFYGSTKNQFHCDIIKYDIVITTYGTLCAEFNEKKRATSPLYTGEWYRVVLDEAHIIKDRNTQTAKACYALNSERRWLLTGTPIQNSLDDFFSFIHFLKAYPYAEYKFWVRRISKPHSYKPDCSERQSAERAIQSLTNFFLLRRTKRTLGEDGMPIVSLPERRVEILRLEPFEEEKKIYLSLYTHSKSTFEMLLSENRLLANFATVLELILRLRQCCNHPDLVLNSSSVQLVDLSSADNFADTMERIFLHSDSSNFSQSTEYLSTVIERLREAFLKGDNFECPICLDMVDDGVMFCSCGHVTCKECVLAMLQQRNSIPCPLCRAPVTKNVIVPLPMKQTSSLDVDKDHCAWQKSSKLVTLVKELKAIEHCRMGHGDYEGLTSVGKSVVFSQWTRCLDMIEAALQDNGLRYVRLDGKMSSKERSKVLSCFRLEQSDSANSANILLVSLKAGGVGLNLTAASQVFIVDPWWNPAVEEQAIGRVHRIGQTRTVIVKRLIIANTIEENLLQVQERKKLVAESMLGSEGSSKDRRQISVEDITLLFKN